MVIIVVFLLFFLCIPTKAADVDPILIDTPNPYVYECTEDLVLELLVNPAIDYSTGGRHAENFFFFLTVEFLYLQDYPWNGLDKNSFFLKHAPSNGPMEIIPLNYMMTAMMGLKNGWKIMADKLDFATLVKYELVFDVNTMDKTGWALIFRPAQRGGSPVCEIEIPLKYFRY